MKLAKLAREKSYCPYSNIAVGAALLTRSGKAFVGTNIENAAFSPTVCAERVAFFKAISEGERDFVAIAVVGGKAGEETSERFSPCGVCRQVMAEFCSTDFEIITESADNATLIELLPHAFGKEALK